MSIIKLGSLKLDIHDKGYFLSDTGNDANNVKNTILANIKHKLVISGDKRNAWRPIDFMNILFMDDNFDVVDVGKMMLDSLGHAVDIAMSGKEALGLLRGKKYDLLIADVEMPEMSGWQLVDAIDERCGDMKIMIMSGWGFVDLEKDRINHKMVDFIITKPFSINDLEKLLKNITEKQC